MTTISITVKDNVFAKLLKSIYETHSDVHSIIISDETENYALPGLPMSLKTFRKKIKDAENGKKLSWESVKKEMKKW